MSQPAFVLDYHSLSTDHPEFGQVAVIPWDTEIFGFPVGKYKVGNPDYLALNQTTFLYSLMDWVSSNRVELISASTPADDFKTLTILRELGFHSVDCSLRATLRKIQSMDFSASPSTLRPAQPEDQESVELLAGEIFNSGHYCADRRFPPALAHKRFRQWLRNAFLSTDPGTHIFVQGAPGNIRGFSHFERKGDLADIRIAGINSNSQSGIARSGFSLYRDTIRAVKELGMKNAVAVVYAANTAALNLHAILGFRFSHSEAQLHWHAPNAPHLVDFKI